MKKYNYEDAVLKEIPEPEKDCTLIPVDISDKTIEQRKQKIKKTQKNFKIQHTNIRTKKGAKKKSRAEKRKGKL